VNFILADIELIGKDSFNFSISLAKYITLMDKIVVLSSIFLRNSLRKIRTHTQGNENQPRRSEEHEEKRL
jgi:hypothetical protein